MCGAQLLNTEYSMSKLIAHTSWHIDPVRTTLTKNMDAVFPAVFEEIAAAFDEYIPASDSGALRPFVHAESCADGGS